MISILNVATPNHKSCEDSYFLKENDDKIYGGVFDGCSSGINSAWASQTFAYLFSKYEDPCSNFSVHSAVMEMTLLSRLLQLKTEQLWSTCILFEFNKSTRELLVRLFGDGFYFINDLEYVVDENDRVDYISNHFGPGGGLHDYLLARPMLSYKDVSSFRICSDGIKSLKRSQFFAETTINPMELLMHPPTGGNYLTRQWNIIKKNNFVNNDDITIISYVHNG